MQIVKRTRQTVEVRFKRGTGADEINKVMSVWLRKHWGLVPTRRQPIYMPELPRKPKQEASRPRRRRKAAEN